jgi:hypothetical protein
MSSMLMSVEAFTLATDERAIEPAQRCFSGGFVLPLPWSKYRNGNSRNTLPGGAWTQEEFPWMGLSHTFALPPSRDSSGE